jgi:hypothetical protein
VISLSLLALVTLGSITQTGIFLFVSHHSHRHLSNIDCLTACTACLVCFNSTVKGHSKKKRNKAKNMALVAGTLQTLSNLFFLLISQEIIDILADKTVVLLSSVKTGSA